MKLEVLKIFFTLFEKMGKAKKLKISKAPRNTPLEENITKVSAVYGRILVKSTQGFFLTRVVNGNYLTARKITKLKIK